MAPLRLVGWMDGSEWESVYHNLYHGNKQQRQSALDQIAVWRARFARRIPVAVEATSRLFESKIMCEGDEEESLKRQCMATAVSQFVGLLTERSLKGQARHIPIHIRGAELGIPEWVVNLRHEAAHGLLPSYFMLEKAIEFSIDWLRKHHWEEQLQIQRGSKQKSNEMDTFEVEKKIITIMRKCIAVARRKSIVNNDGLMQLKNIVSTHPVVAENMGVFLIENNIIPLGRQCLHCFLYSHNSQGRVELKSNFKTLFIKILEILGEYNALTAFLERVISESIFSPQNYDICIFWIGLVLDVVETDVEARKAIPWRGLIVESLMAKFPLDVLRRMIQLSDLENTSEILDFLETNLQSGSDIETLNVRVKNLLGAKFKKKNSKVGPGSNVMEVQPTACESWTLYEESDLSQCPLGLMPGQNKAELWKILATNCLEDPEHLQIEIGFCEQEYPVLPIPDSQITDDEDMFAILEEIDLL